MRISDWSSDVCSSDLAADVKPIAHLYKSQVYGMARFLGLPERVTSDTPTTETYSLAQGQDEFYFAIPYAQMSLSQCASTHDRPVGELAATLGVNNATAQAVNAAIRASPHTRSEEHRRGPEWLSSFKHS